MNTAPRNFAALLDGIRSHPGRFLAMLVLLVAAYLLLFFQLDAFSMRLYDEALYANHSVAMLENGNWIVKYMDGRPDMWVVKPPFMTWVQAAFLKIFGMNVLAIRLPSAIAALLSLALLLRFAWRRLGDPVAGILAAAVLLCTPGFVVEHGSRTGDHDVPLALMTSIFLLQYWLYLQSDQQRGRHLWFAVAALVAAILTKSIMVFLFFPGILVDLLIARRLLSVLRDRRFWLGLGVVVLVVGGYYVAREQLNPGYLQAVWENELGGRFTTAIEGHGEELWHYWGHISQRRFLPWLYFLVPSIILVYARGDVRKRRLLTFLICVILSYFTFITAATTKLLWYDTPLYPLLALIVGLGLQEMREALLGWMNLRHAWLREAAVGAMAYCVFVPCFFAIQKANWFKKEPDSFVAYGYVMEGLEQATQPQPGYGVLETEFNPALEFYSHVAEVDRGIVHPRYKRLEQIQPGMRLLVCRTDMMVLIASKFQYTEIASQLGCKVIEVGPALASP